MMFSDDGLLYMLIKNTQLMKTYDRGKDEVKTYELGFTPNYMEIRGKFLLLRYGHWYVYRLDQDSFLQ